MRYAAKAPHPLANVPIHLETATAARQTTTDSEGNYRFENIPPGTVTVFAGMPQNLGGGERRTISLQAHACSEQNFVAVERAQVGGTVRDDNQSPVVTAEIVVIPAGSPGHSGAIMAFTDPKGVFNIQRVPPGDYVLEVNISEPPREGKYLSHPFPPTYFPGVTDRRSARIIHVNSGEHLAGFNLTLPPRLRQRTISGRVTWADGKPAPGAFIELKDSEFIESNVDLGTADRNGSFVVTGVEGRSYSVRSLIGIRDGETPMHSETVQLRPDTNGPIRLVLSMPGRP